MENAEEVFHFLEEFSKRKPKSIPQELNDYLAYVARTGDPVYQWSLVKCLFKEKLLTVITDFYETTPGIEIPPYPNVDPFNYDIMKNSLIERLDSFTSAPFTVQRICELLTYPRKQYNRIDKFMRAVEKNILVVSTREPGAQRHLEPENGEPMEPVINGSDNNSEYNVDVEMEDMSWKENNEQQNSEPQPSSSDTHISVDDLETQVQNQESPADVHEKATTPSESESTTSNIELIPKEKDIIPHNDTLPDTTISVADIKNSEDSSQSSPELDTGMKIEDTTITAVIIPDIKVDDAEMTEQRLREENKENEIIETNKKIENPDINIQLVSSDESSSDSNCKEESDKVKFQLMSEISTSSEESSSSSDNNESNSNSPKLEVNTNSEDSLHADKKEEDAPIETEKEKEETDKQVDKMETVTLAKIESDNYSISDVNSELPKVPATENKDPKESESLMETVVEESEKTEPKEESVQESETIET